MLMFVYIFTHPPINLKAKLLVNMSAMPQLFAPTLLFGGGGDVTCIRAQIQVFLIIIFHLYLVGSSLQLEGQLQ